MPLDWIAAGLALLGVFLIGQKKRSGFLVCCLCGCLWIVVGIQSKVYGLLLEVVPLLVLNLYNYRKWKNDAAT